MITPAQKHDIDEIFQLLDIIWQDMDFPLRRLLDTHTFQNTMIDIMSLPNSKFSYTHCTIFKENDTVMGVLFGYLGKDEPLLDDHFCQFIEDRFPHLHIRQYMDYRETLDDEWYIDALVVHPLYQQKGIGTALLQHIHHAIIDIPIGLNCEQDNASAQRLYEKNGFQFKTTVQFLGHTYNHLQKLKT